MDDNDKEAEVFVDISQLPKGGIEGLKEVEDISFEDSEYDIAEELLDTTEEIPYMLA